MQGTEKQVAWANDIKAAFVAKLETLPADLRDMILPAVDAEQRSDFWIRNRNMLYVRQPGGALISPRELPISPLAKPVHSDVSRSGFGLDRETVLKAFRDLRMAEADAE